MFVPTVKYVPEWFPGAGFKAFARVARKNLDDSINPPFQHVKKSLKVCISPLPFLVQVVYWNEIQAGTLASSSVVGTCLEELPELSKQGVDEDVIRGMSGVIYLGELQS